MRASTPVSSDVDVSSIRSNDTSYSVAAPQNISLLSQDLTTSLCSLTQSPIKGDDPDIVQQDHQCQHLSASFHSPYPLCDGYVHGSICYGYKLVGDNLDKTIKPRDMRVDHLPQSLHYFNVYAVLDRIDFSSLSCDTSIIDVAEIDINMFLPSADDMELMITSFSILISSLLIEHIPALHEYSSCVPAHIDHKYSREMSAKSHVVRKLKCTCVLISTDTLTGASWSDSQE